MSWHLLVFIGLSGLFVVLLSWWHARRRLRQILIHRATREVERRLAEQIVRERLGVEIAGRLAAEQRENTNGAGQRP